MRILPQKLYRIFLCADIVSCFEYEVYEIIKEQNGREQ